MHYLKKNYYGDMPAGNGSSSELKDPAVSLLLSRISYLIHLADTNLILAQRNAEWCGHGPVLEQDIAITNISLDLLGQARNFYQYAAAIINIKSDISADKTESEVRSISIPENKKATVTEDSLAYFRTEREFKNLLITELPKVDWAHTILRQFFCSVYQYLLYGQLQKNNDAQLAAIAGKSIKEIIYHVKWSSEWVIRLGDGTEESHKRMVRAIENLWPYTGEFFVPADYENKATTGFDLNSLKQSWLDKVITILEEATLGAALKKMDFIFMQSGGKTGIHTEHMGIILAELQYLQRTYPGAEW
ncbi:MAG: 1,2-phenylacetyl-CoA epoxidase subunit PaaC [Ferruginibacter sp.]